MAGMSGMSGMSHSSSAPAMPGMAAPGGGHDDHGDPQFGPRSVADFGEPTEVFLAAFQYGFEPDRLALAVNAPYRFRMMALDASHGASLQMGQASRMIRLRRGVEVQTDLVFTRPGRHLVYCTVYCGPLHDTMRAEIVVA